MGRAAHLLCDLTEPDPVPEAGILRAVELMRSGRLFRYGEMGADQADAALLESEFARLVGRAYCVALNSGGAALHLALRAARVAPGEGVLVNGFTLAPVPGAVLHAGAKPVLVEIGPELVIDPADLDRKAAASGARVLLLSHMRGHIADMDAVMAIVRARGLVLIEDCAHALGASWKGRAIGTFGFASAFSAQTYKHLNAGDGGFLLLDDPEAAARAILHSGSYMLHRQHASRPDEALFGALEGEVANFSSRMTALAAALLRPQLAELPRRVARWRAIHDRIAAGLDGLQHVRLPRRLPGAEPSPTSIQFTLPGFSPAEMAALLAHAQARGLPIKWFGAERQTGFTSAPRHWRYAGEQGPLAATHAVLATLCDIRTPLRLTDSECDLIAAIVRDGIDAVVSERGSSPAEAVPTGRSGTNPPSPHREGKHP